jgi:hypothetical protein
VESIRERLRERHEIDRGWLEIKLPSTTTGASTQMAPAFSRSSLIAVVPVAFFPQDLRRIGIQPPWQMKAPAYPVRGTG